MTANFDEAKVQCHTLVHKGNEYYFRPCGPDVVQVTSSLHASNKLRVMCCAMPIEEARWLWRQLQQKGYSER